MKNQGYIRWEKDYSVGNPLIDRQHKEILNLVSFILMHDSEDQNANTKLFNSIRSKFLDQLREHFATEEAIMQAGAYEEYQAHKNEHDNLVSLISEQFSGIETGKMQLDLTDMGEFVREWVIKHVSTFDKKAEGCFSKAAEPA
jgi:hemerythrin